jgi:stearoyl-CoA desaturase (delta-9 desaturase)
VYVGVHRIHHANSDTELDPTSPNHADKKLYSKVIWQFSDKLPDVTYEKLKKYAPDIQAESLYTNGKLGLATLLFIDVILFNILGIAIWLAQLLWVVFYSAVTLGVCHSGKQQPNTTDRSQNIMPLAIMFGGEELHNNHHKHIASAKFSDKWYEFDIGYFYIRILSALRLATM